MKRRTRQESVRLGLLFVIIICFFSLAVARLIHLQILLGPRYSEIVGRQSSSRIDIPAERGMIYDRYGRLVASNVVRHSLYSYPTNSKELKEVSAYLDRHYSLARGTAKDRFRLKVKKFRYIERRLDDKAARRFVNEAPPGLHLREETRREYPFGVVGKQILGFTNIDNDGLSGIEYSADSLLAGSKGFADVRRDGHRNTYRVKEKALVKPRAGTSLVLTVDWRLQEIVEHELQAAVIKHNASEGKAVFIDCNSGDILAIAHFDINDKNRLRPTKLRAISDQFEPGSVIKAFTAAGLIDADIVDYSDSIFCEEGAWRIGRRVLHDDKKRGWLNFRSVIELSSNIGIGKYACQFGGEQLFETFSSFGLGKKVRCGLPGESKGSLPRPAIWSDYNISALAMGHSVAVTALQLASGFAAVANGGDLLQPQILLGEVAADGSVINRHEKKVIGKVMLPSSVDTLHSFLRGVVERGTAEPVNSPVVAIAGKTGTAEIPNLKFGGYYKNKFNSSFAGFFPYENPVIAGVVVITRPHPVTYGGHTAGPAFRAVAEQYVVANPDIFADPDRTLIAKSRQFENTIEVPDLIGRDVILARTIARERGIRLREPHSDGMITWQFPPADRLLYDEDEMIVAVDALDDISIMSDLTGLSIRSASAFLAHRGIHYAVSGSGHVVKQSIRAGEPITKNSLCKLVCKPGQRRGQSN